jgi:hypothetical protein
LIQQRQGSDAAPGCRPLLTRAEDDGRVPDRDDHELVRKTHKKHAHAACATQEDQTRLGKYLICDDWAQEFPLIAVSDLAARGAIAVIPSWYDVADPTSGTYNYRLHSS